MLQKRGYAVIGALRGNFYGLMGRQVVKWEEPPAGKLFGISSKKWPEEKESAFSSGSSFSLQATTDGTD